MTDKYSLTRKQSVFLAKKLMADVVCCGLWLEGSEMTFPDIQTILYGVHVPDAALDDIQAVLNMRGAWRYVQETLDEPFSLDYACRVNGFVAGNESPARGVLRTGRVGISGTEYVPPIPDRDAADAAIRNLMESQRSVTEKALAYFAWGAKSQLFWEGNRRTSLICSNKILLQEGKGLLSIRESGIKKFNRLLTNYYEETTGDEHYRNLTSFLYNESIRGIEFENDQKPQEKFSFARNEMVQDQLMEEL